MNSSANSDSHLKIALVGRVQKHTGLFLILLFCSSFPATNVALNQSANQTEDVVWNGWTWSADKAVDGCTLANDPDNQFCCSTSQPTQGQAENWWRVELSRLYVISRVVITGRSGNDSYYTPVVRASFDKQKCFIRFI